MVWLLPFEILTFATDIYFFHFYSFWVLKIFGYPTGLGALLARNGKQFVQKHLIFCDSDVKRIFSL